MISTIGPQQAPGSGLRTLGLVKSGQIVEHSAGGASVTVTLDMCTTCQHAEHVSRMIQLRNVPDSLYRKLKNRAAMAGMSLSDYLLAEIRLVAERPTLAHLRERLQRREPVTSPPSAARAVRAERDIR